MMPYAIIQIMQKKKKSKKENKTKAHDTYRQF
jgi:hypothetical protein